MGLVFNGLGFCIICKGFAQCGSRPVVTDMGLGHEKFGLRINYGGVACLKGEGE